ncbi:MAG: hypothetical protein COB04_07980 [Gammaproteobacteria bacterium]|nr:MAG: hypothetical protein COB04_07980 [Gammaproteobacteria bacterium]
MGIFSRDKADNDTSSEQPHEEEGSPLDEPVLLDDAVDLKGNIDFGNQANSKMSQRARPPTFSYGIEHAIQLMRELPEGELEIVVTVVKKTLESMSVTVTDIIQDAEFKEQEIQQKSDQLIQEIEDLESEISDRKMQIDALNADAKETALVKNHLKLAEQINKDEPSASPPQLDLQEDSVAASEEDLNAEALDHQSIPLNQLAATDSASKDPHTGSSQH